MYWYELQIIFITYLEGILLQTLPQISTLSGCLMFILWPVIGNQDTLHCITMVEVYNTILTYYTCDTVHWYEYTSKYNLDVGRSSVGAARAGWYALT